VVETDWSVPRALERVVRREHRDLLVLGSSCRAPEGRSRIGSRTRQLLGDAQCALAIALKGQGTLHAQLETIGVGYDGSPEAADALTRAGTLARLAGADLHVRAVVDDRLPSVGWSPPHGADLQEIWDDALAPDVKSLRHNAERVAAATGAETVIQVKPASPTDELVALSREVHLLVIGSRRWGADARVLLGTTGEALLNDARCSVLVVPRPPAVDAPRLLS
jgi:nucleotide-binding universal stress UspA family protein